GQVGAGEAELIVLRSALLIAEHVIRLLRFLESCLGLLIAGIAVRVVLPGELAIGFLDLVFAGAFFEAQGFVIIAGHGKSAAGAWSWNSSGYILALCGQRAKIPQGTPLPCGARRVSEGFVPTLAHAS